MIKEVSAVLVLIFFISCGENIRQTQDDSSSKIISENLIFDSTKNPLLSIDSVFFFEDYSIYNTKSKIDSFFEKNEVKHGTSHYEEGTLKVKHSIVTDRKRNAVIKYIWNQDQSLKFIEASFIILDKDFNEINRQIIKTKCGFDLGFSIDNLVRWNEKPISFYGFGWDDGGGLIKERGSKLYNCPLEVYLDIEYNNNVPNEIIGDIELNSDNIFLKKSKVFVSRIVLNVTSLQNP